MSRSKGGRWPSPHTAGRHHLNLTMGSKRCQSSMKLTLGLNPTQLAVLMQICDFWWENDRKPYPSKATLAERLGLSPRQEQRHIADLEEAGLVRRIEQRAHHGGKHTNLYDLTGLGACPRTD